MLRLSKIFLALILGLTVTIPVAHANLGHGQEIVPENPGKLTSQSQPTDVPWATVEWMVSNEDQTPNEITKQWIRLMDGEMARMCMAGSAGSNTFYFFYFEGEIEEISDEDLVFGFKWAIQGTIYAVGGVLAGTVFHSTLVSKNFAEWLEFRDICGIPPELYPVFGGPEL